MESAMTPADTQLLHVSCNICGSSNEKLITIQNGYRIVKCNCCGFVYVNPRPDNETLKRLYLKYLPEKILDPLLWDAYMKDVFEKAAKILMRRFPKRGKVLDIGCGYGFFLKQMKAMGWQAYGVDVSETAVLYAKKHGIRTTLGTLDNIKYDANYFDAVTLFYVLEHLPDPLNSIKEVKRILKPNGLLLLRVPHTTPIVRILKILGIKNNLYDPPFHLNDFSPQTVKALLKKGGFSNIRTYIGGATSPPSGLVKAVTAFFGILAETVYTLSFGRILLSGVAKNTIAEKQG
ncbi:MAG TPA: class I SAM-dependent methyltransferase [Thermodesulfobacteriota bacterium]|nr:class I SAM-dependent methyltransferase [Thermodesulfobacteriota bacterium]